MSGSSSSSSGMGFLGGLQLLFVALKLTGYVEWPWWQVLIPAWLWLGFMAAVLALLGLACREKAKSERRAFEVRQRWRS